MKTDLGGLRTLEGSAMIGLVDHAITTAFTPLIGLPCRGVYRVQGSIFSFEFGQPHLVMREPRASKSPSARVRRRLAQRIVKPVGEWHLLIYACHWRVTASGEAVVDDTGTTEAIDAAIRELSGQKLTRLVLDAGSCTTTFVLDGATLSTWPIENDIDDQWSLYMPNDQVLTYRTDGCYSLGRGDVEPGQEVWHAVISAVDFPKR